MFSDIVGYTAASQRNEALALDLLEEHNRLLRSFLQKHNGREIKTMGDSLMVEFSSALEAVRCAFEIQQSLHERNSSQTPEKRIIVRIGIHVGDVIEKKGDVIGDAVNVASRIESIAKPGGICITEQVYDHIWNKFEFPATNLGRHELKNVHLPIEIYEILLPWDKQDRREEPALDKRRIAVLPFTNISPDPKDEYFADGMTEELISTISNMHELSVISRTSAMRYKRGRWTVSEIGKELNVGTVLEGSVRKVGNRVRISTQLIEVQSDRPLWSRTYEKELLDVFAIQSDVAHRVARALKVQMLIKEKLRIEKKMTTDAEAYTQYLRGRLYWNQRSQEGLNRAIEYFKLVIKKDPNYALAYSGLADCHAILAVYGYLAPSEAFATSKELATKAMELDDSLAEVHTSLAYALAGNDWNWTRAEEEYNEAISLNPNYATANHWYAIFLATRGRMDEAIAQITRAQELDPFSAIINVNMGSILQLAGRYDQAIEQHHKALLIDPDFAVGHIFLGLAYLRNSMAEEAIAEMQKAVTLSGGSALAKANLAYAFALSGMMDRASVVLKELTESSKTGYMSPFVLAIIYAGMDEKEGVVTWLEKACEEHHSIPNNLFFVIPLLVNLRSDPKRIALLKKMGLEQ